MWTIFQAKGQYLKLETMTIDCEPNVLPGEACKYDMEKHVDHIQKRGRVNPSVN